MPACGWLAGWLKTPCCCAAHITAPPWAAAQPSPPRQRCQTAPSAPPAHPASALPAQGPEQQGRQEIHASTTTPLHEQLPKSRLATSISTGCWAPVSSPVPICCSPAHSAVPWHGTAGPPSPTPPAPCLQAAAVAPGTQHPLSNHSRCCCKHCTPRQQASRQTPTWQSIWTPKHRLSQLCDKPMTHPRSPPTSDTAPPPPPGPSCTAAWGRQSAWPSSWACRLQGSTTEERQWSISLQTQLRGSWHPIPSGQLM